MKRLRARGPGSWLVISWTPAQTVIVPAMKFEAYYRDGRFLTRILSILQCERENRLYGFAFLLGNQPRLTREGVAV